MAGTTYRLIIEDQTSGTRTPVSTGGGVEEAKPVQAKEKAKGSTMANVMVATNVVRPYVQQLVSFGVSNIEMATGSAAMQRKVEAFSGIGSTAVSIVTAGIVGGAPAAAAAAGVMLIQKTMEAALNKMQIEMQKRVENENIALRKSRAGMSTNRSRGGGTV